MFAPFAYIFRRFLLRRHASPVATSVRPLSSLGSVKVLMDSAAPDFHDSEQPVRELIRSLGLRADFLCVDVGKAGPRRALESYDNEDLFICLADSDNLFVRFSAACSRASFKVGRRQLPGNVFDLVVDAPAGCGVSQKEVLENILGIISKIS